MIELIIVIAILAILAAILVPLMIGWLDDARSATANANARTVYSAAAAAAVDLMSKSMTVTIASIGTITNTGTAPAGTIAVTDPKAAANLTATDFETKIGALLGDGFEGLVAVRMATDGQTIERVTWQAGTAAGTIIGTYPAMTNMQRVPAGG